MASATDLDNSTGSLQLTGHASERMTSRRISSEDVAAVMSYGRCYYVRGAIVYALGERDVRQCRVDGYNADRIKGLQVVCSPDNNSVITAYRNNDFSRLKKRVTRWQPGRA